jgi:uncharacterized membrane protein
MSEKPINYVAGNRTGSRVPETTTPPQSNLTTIVGSTGAIIGALGVTMVANVAAPVVAALVTGVGTAVAVGALYKKFSDDRNRQVTLPSE